MRSVLICSTIMLLMLSACAETSIQPMSKDTFKVSTNAEGACGPSGARNVAFKAAAIEVIRKGGDKFIIVNDASDMGMQGDIFTGLESSYAQGLVVRMINPISPEAPNALSAREQLGAGWQEIVSKGVPITCT